MIKVFNQLDKGVVPEKIVVVPIYPKTLIDDNKRKSLEAVNLIEENRYSRIKGQTCAYCSNQNKYLKGG